MDKKELRIVFMGTPDFAVESLKILVENKYNVVGVITVPDKPAGRGQKLRVSPVKQYAIDNQIQVLQPDKLKAESFLAELKELQAHLQVVVAFRMLPEVVWDMPSMGSFNLHGSLLPQYRGAAPINWAVINGEKETGVTTFFLQHEIDTGNIIDQKVCPISPTDTAGSIHDKLMVIGAKLVLETVQRVCEGNIETTPQDTYLSSKNKLSAAPKIFKNDCKLDWNNSSETIFNMIRGLSPYPAAWTEFKDADGKIYSAKLFDAEIDNSTRIGAGKVNTDGKSYLTFGTLNGAIKVKSIQLAGKKRMKLTDLLNGFNIDNSFTLQ
ncbi:methionyl-tRNA formyltransferase [bacterium]|nr:methionyl-tRNA formyltransferase [bacterium]